MVAFHDTDTSIGAEVEVDDWARLTEDPATLDAVLDAVVEALDRRAVVRIASEAPITGASVEAVQARLGRPAFRGGPFAVDGYDFLQEFCAEAKFDDGRERTPGFIESLHYDEFDNGPAAYAVQVLLTAPETVPMRFVDMRAVYADLPEATRARVAQAGARHISRPSSDGTRAPSTIQPVAARHPRTGHPVLLLANKRTSRLEGLAEDEGRALHAELWDAVEASPARYERVMRANEMYIWDNLACVHDNPAFPRAHARRSWFFNILRDGAIEPIEPLEPAVTFADEALAGAGTATPTP